MRSRLKSTVLVAYVPAPHSGYLKLFRKYTGGILYILGEDFIQKFPSLVRHLPGVKPEEARRMIGALDIFSDVRVLTFADIDTVRRSAIIMPDEDVSRVFAKEYFAEATVVFDDCWRLRWDWGATQKKRRPGAEGAITRERFDQDIIRSAFRLATRSPDWWRQIGALLVREGEVLIATFNRHVPCEQSAYLEGDPRSNFEQGQYIECSSALHAEAGIVAEAARRGLSMDGCYLYVTTFPCPPCAYLCAHTGIRRLYYADGYSLVAGAETLQANDVEIIHVEC
jgi:dCMP deaminase